MTFADIVNLALNGIVTGMLVALPALAVSLVYGLARFPNAATGDVVSTGGYAGLFAYTASGSLLAAGAGAAAIGALVGLASYYLAFRAILRRSVITSLLTSIGVGFVIRALLGVMFGHQPRTFDMPITRAARWHGVMLNPTDGQLVLVTLAVLAIVFTLLYGTSMGRKMRALADDADLARVSGIGVERSMVTMWALTGAVCGIAGMMVGVRTVVSPDAGWDTLLPAFAAAVVGGLGNPLGAVVGAILLGVLQEWSTPLVGFVYKIALAYVVMLVVLLIRPQGLFNRVQGVR